MSKAVDKAAMAAIFDYLNKQNRPYSAIDIFNNLHKAYGKTAVEKALEALADEGRIQRKIYGKQKVFVADQSQFPVMEDTELKSMDGKIVQLSEKVKMADQENRVLESEFRSFSSALSTEEASKKLAETKQQIEKLEQKLSALKSASNSVSPEERQKVLQNRTKYVKEWRKRKRMAMDIINAVLEGYPKTKKDLYEEVGIETDEDYNVKPPEL